ncbi:MAG: hypothetical protein OIF48_06470 [Silicimonas sp.]|nr:hypothetical protein [Silicimonas sp.]
MALTDALEALRSELPGCALVAYADLTSGLVLGTAAAGHPGQEELDQLAGAAQQALAGAVAEGAAPVWAEAGGPAAVALLATETEVRLFLRADGAAEALICVLAADGDLPGAMTQARAGLAGLQETAG